VEYRLDICPEAVEDRFYIGTRLRIDTDGIDDYGERADYLAVKAKVAGHVIDRDIGVINEGVCPVRGCGCFIDADGGEEP
jgi:hypothetical protein